MKTFTREYRIYGEYPDQFSRYFSGKKPCVFDIEATGLDPSRCKVCLAAFLVRTDSGIRITQFLSENHYEENRVLRAMCDYLEKDNIDYLITFNGRAYDIPFVNRRLECTFPDKRISVFNFDLYRFLRKGTSLKSRVSSMSQMSLENYYGIFSDRNDTITGRESVALFDEYSLTGNSVIEKVILTHNREDVLQLHRLMFLSMDEPEDFDAAMAAHGFPSSDGRLVIRPFISRQAKSLRICGEQLRDPVSAAYFPDSENPLTIQFNAESSSFQIDVPAGYHDGMFYIDTAPLGLDLSEDPDCVNGYLILSPRTINSVSLMISDRIIQKI